MPLRELPARPNLDNLKKQAKSLLDAASARDQDALLRFTILPALAGKSIDEVAVSDLALHDAQSAIAREHGFPSWNALREEVEARTLSFDAAVEEFIRSATGGGSGRAHRLLALHPGISTASLQTALVLGDAGAVERRLADHPELATRAGGPMNWEPLLYACHTCMHVGDPGRVEGLVAIAQRLCALGANPNGEYHWNWHPELPRTALWAAVCVIQHLPLAETLLRAGANPTDGVTSHIASGGGNLEALELLHRYGLNVNGIPGGVPPLVHMLQWADTPVGARWLLDHGADANLPWGADGEAPLHVAARRWDVPMVDYLVAHGADVLRRRADGATPHTLAELNGNPEIAAWLLAHGAIDELSPVDRFIAACARGDRSAADALLAARPSLRNELRPEHHLMLHRPAESGNAKVLETMLACGFDVEARDKDTFTPLHRAAMGGHVEAVRVLLAHGADVNAVDGTFAASPLVCAVEGRSHSRHPDADFVGVARLLIAAGSSLEWHPPEGAPGPERTLEGLADLRRAAAEPAAMS
jgi:ankyrin repeat protein